MTEYTFEDFFTAEASAEIKALKSDMASLTEDFKVRVKKYKDDPIVLEELIKSYMNESNPIMEKMRKLYKESIIVITPKA